MGTPQRGPYRQTPNAVIRPDQGWAMRTAAVTAQQKGWPLDRMITLNFSLTDCDEAGMPKAFEYIRDMAVRWYRYEAAAGRVMPGDEFAFIWVLEHVGDFYHAHWLVHLPAKTERRFRQRLDRRSLRAAGVARQGYLNLKAFDHMGPIYLTKGMGPEEFTGPRSWRTRAGGQGYFHSKRCGVSSNLRLGSTSPADAMFTVAG